MPGIVLSLIVALADSLCAALGREDIRVVTKPLVALILAGTAWRGGARYLAAGLVAAAIGDELLLRDDPTRFMAGMGAFLLMHVFYIVGFSKMVPYETIRKQSVVTLLYALAGVATLVTLRPYAGAMYLPLTAYSIALVIMARYAFNVSTVAAIGGLIFMASDTTLAFAKFYPGFPLPPTLTGALVDGSYFIAQMLIVAGVLLRRKRTGDVLGGAT